jgi:alkanesulfonate monooxygenase SsuD/methylene tetrahydromethanopterin reductase-like flavin-dependent oxidoreductase (luciferase family)/predicted kinase
MPAIPLPALVVLIGPSGAGKSTWAARHFAASEIVSSDRLRALVGTGESDLDASKDAFDVLDLAIKARLRRRLTTVVDTLGLDAARRAAYRDAARAAGVAAVAVRFDAPPELCRARNRRRDRPVPAPALTAQLRSMAELRLDDEGWDVVLTADESQAVEEARSPGTAAATTRQFADPARLRFGLQISRFPWADDPRGWLTSVVQTAEEVGFDSVAVMDHLMQIPHVGRMWEPMPEAYVTLGFLAARTQRMEIGTLVTPPTFRAPGVLAKMIATLDVVSGGRAFCGLGAGWFDREHAAHGLPFPPTGARFDALETEIAVLRALWSPGSKPAAGLPETTSYPRPLHDVPIIVGGAGERRSLDIVARLADGTNLHATLPDLAHKLDVLRAHCDRVGRSYDELRITVLDWPLVGRDRDHVATLVESMRGPEPAERFVAGRPIGTAEHHIGRYRLLAELGVDTVFVALANLHRAEDLELLAPVIAAFR